MATSLHVEISTTKSRGGKSRRRTKIKKSLKTLPLNGSGNGDLSNEEIDEETEDNSASHGEFETQIFYSHFLMKQKNFVGKTVFVYDKKCQTYHQFNSP